MTERVGFIGLGLMGKPMSRHLLAAGYPLTVFNRSRPAINELISEGAREAPSPREVAEQCDIMITMLPADSDVEKDLRIAQQIAQKYEVALPVGTLVEQLFTSLVASGGGDLDHSALLTVLERLSDFSLVQSGSLPH